MPTYAWIRPLLCASLLTLSFACSSDDTAETGAETTGTTGTEDSSTETGETETGETGEGPTCFAEMHAIVTDIDETLTTSDAEFIMQLQDSSYDPLEREEGAELMTDYHDRGFTLIYLTARAESGVSADDIPARELTEDWLVEHGFPFDDNTQLILAPTFVVGDAAAEYKAEALIGLQDEGFMFDYAYGNATSDIAAFEAAGIAKDTTFIIGEEAGVEGTVAVEEEDWIAHRAAHMPMVMDYCGG